MPKYHSKPGVPDNCLDSASLKRQYLDGNLDLLGHKIDNFTTSSLASGTSIPLPCWVQIEKYAGVIAIAVKRDTSHGGKYASTRTDTALGREYFLSLVNIDPYAEILDLAVPLGIQATFDQAKVDKNIQYNSEEMFRLRILPSPSSDPPPTKRAQLMREKYHDIRTNYYLALDSVSFAMIAKLLVGETDPAYQLTNAEIMTKIGVSLRKAKKLVEDAKLRESEILTSQSVSDWSDRLKMRINSMQAKSLGPGTTTMHTIFGDKGGKKKNPNGQVGSLDDE